MARPCIELRIGLSAVVIILCYSQNIRAAPIDAPPVDAPETLVHANDNLILNASAAQNASIQELVNRARWDSLHLTLEKAADFFDRKDSDNDEIEEMVNPAYIQDSDADSSADLSYFNFFSSSTKLFENANVTSASAAHVLRARSYCQDPALVRKFCDGNIRGPKWKLATSTDPHSASVVHIQFTKANYDESLCTGTLVDTNVVLTNAHCAPAGFRDMQFYFDYYGENSCYTDLSSSAIIWKSVQLNRILDYALVTLNKHMDRRRVAKFAAEDPMFSTTLRVLQHPQGISMRTHSGALIEEQKMESKENPRVGAQVSILGTDALGGSSGSSVRNSNGEIMALVDRVFFVKKKNTWCDSAGVSRTVALRVSELKKHNKFFRDRISARIKNGPELLKFSTSMPERPEPWEFNRWCFKNKYAAGHYLGSVCSSRDGNGFYSHIGVAFPFKAVVVQDATTEQLKVYHQDFNVAINRWAKARNFIAGWWNGESSGNLRGVICLKKDYGLWGDIKLSSEAYDSFTGKKNPSWMRMNIYARSHGFELALPTFEKHKDLRGTVFMSPSKYLEVKELTAFLNSCPSQGLGLTGQSPISTDEMKLSSGPSAFPDDSVDLLADGSRCGQDKFCQSKRCFGGICCRAQNCVYGAWSSYSKCRWVGKSTVRTRTREILKQPSCGGTQCSGPLSENEPCVLPTPTNTPSPVPTPTTTSSPTPTASPTLNSPTASPTLTPPTASPTDAPLSPPSETASSTPTSGPSPTLSATPVSATATPTALPTDAPLSPPSETASSTPTSGPSPTLSATLVPAPAADCVALATLHRQVQTNALSSLGELVLGFWHEDRDDVEVLCFYEDEHVCVTPMHLVRHKNLRDGQNVPAKELCAAGLLPCTRKHARVAAPVFRGAGGVEWMRDIGVTSSAHTWHARELMFGWRVTLDSKYSHALHEAGRLLWYVPRDAVRRAYLTGAR